MTNVGLQIILGADVSSADQALNKFYSSVQTLAKNIQSTLSGMGGTMGSVNQMFKPLEDGAMNATKTLINESKVRVQADKEATSAAINAGRARIAALREEAAASRINTQSKTKELGAYAMLSANASQLTKTYQNEAAAASLAGDKSERTAAKIREMAAAANEANENLKRIDAGAGRFGRNVGNYSGATQYLRQSIAQISGEIPNFFQSMRIGFMSIGNNIQPISQGIALLRKENAELAASGQPVKNIFKEVAGSFLGWQTLMLVGVGLISRYGSELIDMVTGTDKAKAAAKELADEQQRFNQITESANQTAGQQVAKLELLNATMTDGNLSMTKRTAAYDEAKKLYPSYLGHLEQDQALNQGIAKIIDTQLVPAILAAAQARAYEGKITEIATKNIELAQKKKLAISQKNQADTDRLIAKANKRDQNRTAAGNAGTGSAMGIGFSVIADQAEQKFQAAAKAVQDLDDQITNNTAHINALAVSASEAIGKTGKLGTDGIDPLDKTAKVAKTHVDALTKSGNNLSAEFAETAAKLQAGVISKFQAIQENAKAVQSHLDSLFKNGGTQTAIQENIDLLKTLQYQMQALAGIDLNQAKGNLLGGNAQDQFHNYIQGIEEAKKRAEKLSAGFYNELGIQDPREAIKRRDVYSQFDALGIDSSKYIDPAGTAKQQEKQGQKALDGLQDSYSKFGSTTGRLLSRSMDPFVEAVFSGKNAFDAINDSVKSLVAELAKVALKAGILSLLGNGDQVKSAGGFGGIFKGLLGIGLKGIPFLADGGIVTRPTLAMIVEAGPEAVTPLNKLGNYGGRMTVDVRGTVRGTDLNLVTNNFQRLENR